MAELLNISCWLFCVISFLLSNINGGLVVVANTNGLEKEQDDFLEYIQSDNITSSSVQDDDKEGYLSSRSLPTESIHSGAHLPISNYGSSDIDDVLSYARYANSGPNTIRQERSLSSKHNAELAEEKEPFEYSRTEDFNSQEVALDIESPDQPAKRQELTPVSQADYNTRQELTPVSQSDYNPGSIVSIGSQSGHSDTEQLTLSNQEDYPKHFAGYTEADPHQLTPDKQAEFLREFKSYAKQIYEQKVAPEESDKFVYQRESTVASHSQNIHPEASHLLSQNPGNRGNYQTNQDIHQSLHGAEKADSLVDQRQSQYSPKLKPITQKFERSYVPPKENYGFNALRGRNYYERQSAHTSRSDRHHKTHGHLMAQTDSDHIRGSHEGHEKDNHFGQSVGLTPQSYWTPAASNDDSLLAAAPKTELRPQRPSKQHYVRRAPSEENLKGPSYQLHNIIDKVNSDLKNVKYAEESIVSQYKDPGDLKSQYKDPRDFDEDVESIIEQSAVAPLRLLAEAKIHLPIEDSAVKQSSRQQVYEFLLPQKGNDKQPHAKSYIPSTSQSFQVVAGNNVGPYGNNAKSFQYTPQWVPNNNRNQIQQQNPHKQFSNRQWYAGGTNSVPSPTPVLVYVTSKSPLQEFYKRIAYGYLQKGYQPHAVLTSNPKSPTAVSKGKLLL